jgi:gamma-glutamylputrescine oxidase
MRAVIVGGGIAGLTVAQELLKRGVRDIALIEADVCGSGATGRSSGFITPASELQLTDLVTRFGGRAAKRLWDAAQDGCDSIARTITTNRIACDRIAADSFWVASDEQSYSTITEEHETRKRLGYASRLENGGVRWGRSFAIDGFKHAQKLSAALKRRGVEIHEHTRATSVTRHRVVTAKKVFEAGAVFACADRETAELNIARNSVYHALTFLMLSEPISRAAMKRVFPNGPLLVWDTDLIYQYYRPARGSRILLGGGLLRKTYASHVGESGAVKKHLRDYFHDRFPDVRVRFKTWRPGFIGVTKDFLPLAGRIDDGIYIAACAAGLPWSVVAAKEAVALALEGRAPLQRYLAPDREFTAFDRLQPILRRRATFALSHGYLHSPLLRKK